MAGGTGMDEAGSDGRLGWVDVAKGLCIVLVVMMHATLGTGEAMGGEGALHRVVAFARPFRIPDFFLLSGLFLGRVIGRDWRLFADRRAVHFAYFYVLWLLIQSGFKAGPIVADAHGPSEAMAAFGLHLARALVEPYSTLWFIYLLAVFSVTTKLLHARVPMPALLGAAAVLQMLPLHDAPDLIAEFCGRYVYFLIGFVFAPAIFALAERVQRHAAPALVGLGAWALGNGALALLDTGWVAYPTPASLPGVGLLAGVAGAGAIVAVAALLHRAGGPVARALRLCGQRSIAIYLAFFLPMAATRAAVARTDLDIGLACLLVTIVAVVVPLALERAVRDTRLAFLFRRPAAFHIAPAPRREAMALRPA